MALFVICELKDYGYALEGDDAVKTQLVIDSLSFCTIGMLGIEAFDLLIGKKTLPSMGIIF